MSPSRPLDAARGSRAARVARFGAGDAPLVAPAAAAARDGRADDADVELAPGDLDGVGLLDALVLVVARLRGRRVEGERFEPVAVLQQVAARLALRPLLGGQQRAMKRDERLETLDLVLGERAQHARRGLLAVGVPDDELGHHRVVHRRDLAARAHPGVHAHAGSARLDVGPDPAGRRRELLRRVLGVDAALDRVAAQDDVVLRERQRLAGGDPDARLDDVDPGRHLRHAVLDLDAGVHLQEEVLARMLALRVHQQPLDGARRRGSRPRAPPRRRSCRSARAAPRRRSTPAPVTPR